MRCHLMADMVSLLRDQLYNNLIRRSKNEASRHSMESLLLAQSMGLSKSHRE